MLVVASRQTYPEDHAFACPNGTDRYTLELTYSGVMLRRCGRSRRFRLQPNNTLLLTPPGVPYALQGRDEGDEIWLIFDPPPSLQECLDWPRGEFGIPELHVPPTPLGRQVLQAFEDAQHFMSSRLTRRQELAENALERLLLLAEQLRAETDTPPDQRIQSVLTVIEQEYHAALTVETLAHTANLSPSHFAHLFRRETGVSPMQYLESIRLEQAQLLLLRTDLQIQEIASRVGFDDPFYFSTRFRRRLGCAPSAWRTRPEGFQPG